MLHRHEGRDLVVISQPSHAWISGQLASQWGNAHLGLQPPGPELRIAAEQHDIAWLDWEAAPTLNRETGLPHTFSQLPTIEHLQVWGNARKWAMSYGRLPALLISMHGTYLYDRFHDYDGDSTAEAQAAREFLSREKVHQGRIFANLQQQRDISQKQIQIQRRLISLWDAISLRLCMGFDEPIEFDQVPAANEDVVLTFYPRAESGKEFTVEPWPFATDTVDLRCDGRLLIGTFKDEDEMRSVISSAPGREVEFKLTPA